MKGFREISTDIQGLIYIFRSPMTIVWRARISQQAKIGVRYCRLASGTGLHSAETHIRQRNLIFQRGARTNWIGLWAPQTNL